MIIAERLANIAPGDPGMLDITDPVPGIVEVVIDHNRLWVNVDGICRLRAQDCRQISLTGNHPGIYRPRSPRAE